VQLKWQSSYKQMESVHKAFVELILPVQAVPGVVKIAMHTDGILIQFLFHILRFQVSGVRNDEQRR